MKLSINWRLENARDTDVQIIQDSGIAWLKFPCLFQVFPQVPLAFTAGTKDTVCCALCRTRAKLQYKWLQVCNTENICNENLQSPGLRELIHSINIGICTYSEVVSLSFHAEFWRRYLVFDYLPVADSPSTVSPTCKIITIRNAHLI